MVHDFDEEVDLLQDEELSENGYLEEINGLEKVI